MLLKKVFCGENACWASTVITKSPESLCLYVSVWAIGNIISFHLGNLPLWAESTSRCNHGRGEM